MKLIIQAGHEGRTTGATGAPGEQSFNKDTSNRVADALRALGVEVRRVDADPTAAEVAGDWDLFLSIHYDSDSYNADGGFTDYPEPVTDAATVKSQAIAKTLAAEFFSLTGIRNVPSRSNKNTRFYYMWKMISSKTPCVIIECGVGNRKPKDYDPLNTNRSLVVTGIVNGLKKALNIQGGAVPMPEKTLLTYLGVSTEVEARAKLKQHLGERDARCDWGSEEADRGGFLGSSRREVKRLRIEIENLSNDATDSPVNLARYEDVTVTTEITDGNTKTITNYRRK